jgi:hypothetical protein
MFWGIEIDANFLEMAFDIFRYVLGMASNVFFWLFLIDNQQNNLSISLKK